MIKYLLKKEFKQIVRNPILPKMIFAFPLMVLLASFRGQQVTKFVI